MMGSRRVATVLALATLVAACTDTPSLPPTATPGPPGSSAPAPASTPSATDAPGSSGVPAPQTSTDLIQAGVADGRLDESTGLLYRVFALFEDPRLPSEYTAATPQEDVFAMMRAPALLATMPPEIADQVRPYLVRPTDPESIYHDVTDGGTAFNGAQLAEFRPLGLRTAAAVTCDPQDHWGYTDGTQYLRVWGRCGDPGAEAELARVASAADAIYLAESQYLGGRKPNEDSGGEAQGWDGRLDIYLTSNCITRDTGVAGAPTRHCLTGDRGLTPGSTEFIQRGGVDTSSAFILIHRGLIGNATKLNDVLAHELFHAFEYSYNTGGFDPAGGADWMLDASAVWAQWQFAHAPQVPAQAFAAFEGSKVSLQSPRAGNGYLSFGWPLFLEQDGGAGTVRRAWEQFVGKANSNQIMDALDGVLSFDSKFRIFGMRGWNKEIQIKEPVIPWLPAEPVSPGGARARPYGPKSPDTIELEGTDKGAAPRSLPGDSPSLWAHYQHFTVKDDVGQVTLDFSGVTPANRLEVDALVKIKDKDEWERRELPDGKTTWCVDNPKDAVEEFVVVLSNHAHRLGETLSGNWKVESPKEPCLSYHIRIDWTETWNGNPDKVVFDGYADTINPDALGGQVMLLGEGIYDGDRDGYLDCNPGLAGLPKVSRGKAIFQAVIVGDRVTVSAFADYLTDFAGVNTNLFEGPRKGTFNKDTGVDEPVALHGTDPAGNVCTHGYYGTATIEIQLKPPP